MLQRLNERIQGVVAWVVIALIAMTFAFFGIDYFVQSQHESKALVLTVNGEPVTKEAFDLNFKRISQQQDVANSSSLHDATLKKQVLENMVMNMLMAQAGEALGFFVSNLQAFSAIQKIPQFQQDGHFSQMRYLQALSAALFTPQEFEAQVKQGIILNQLRFSFIGTAFVLPNELNDFVNLYLQRRDYEYLEIPVKWFTSESTPPATEIQTYYQNHKQAFMMPPRVTVEVLELSLPEIKHNIQVNAADVARYYQNNLSVYTVPPRWQVTELLFAIPPQASTALRQALYDKAEAAYKEIQQNPRAFEKFAKKYARDKKTESLPWLYIGQTPFDSVLPSLTNPGDISKVVLSDKGYEILKVVHYEPPKAKPLSEVHKEVETALIAEEARKQYNQSMEQLFDLSAQHPNTLKPASDAIHVPTKHYGPFTLNGHDISLFKDPRVLKTLLSEEVLKFRNNSAPIMLEDGHVCVLRVEDWTSETVKPLDQVKPFIVDTLSHHNAENKARDWAMQFMHASDTEQKALLTPRRAVWKRMTNMMRDSDKVSAAINQVAFHSAKPDYMDVAKMPNGDYLIVRLIAIHPGNIATLDEEQKRALVQQMEANAGMMDYDLLAASVVKKAKVERHNVNLA